MIHSNASFSAKSFPETGAPLTAMSESSAQRIALIDGIIKEQPSSSAENRAVSQDELSALLGSD
jgi:hypothetical protein